MSDGFLIFGRGHDGPNDASTSTTGALISSNARISYTAAWFDGIDRPIAAANYGAIRVGKRVITDYVRVGKRLITDKVKSGTEERVRNIAMKSPSSITAGQRAIRLRRQHPARTRERQRKLI